MKLRARFSGLLYLILSCSLILTAGFAEKASQDVEPMVRFSADTVASFTLHGNDLGDPDSLASPGDIAVGDTYILVADDKASSPLLIFDRALGDLITSAGALGEGPNEIASISTFDFKPGSDGEWIFDIGSRALRPVDMDSLIATGVLRDDRVRLEAEGQPLSPVWAGRDSIVSTGFYSSGKMAVFEPDGSFRRLVGPTPPGPADTPVPVRQHAHQSELRQPVEE